MATYSYSAVKVMKIICVVPPCPASRKKFSQLARLFHFNRRSGGRHLLGQGPASSGDQLLLGDDQLTEDDLNQDCPPPAPPFVSTRPAVLGGVLRELHVLSLKMSFVSYTCRWKCPSWLHVLSFEVSLVSYTSCRWKQDYFTIKVCSVGKSLEVSFVS